MEAVCEGKLAFIFNESCEPSSRHYDEWTFYKNHFQGTLSGIKAVDFVAVDSNNCVWLIEVKDYRVNRIGSSKDLIDELCTKVIHTLSGLLAAKFNANVKEEQLFARKVAAAKKLRVVFHLEQPETNSKMFPQSFNPATLQMKISQKLKAIDPRACIASMKKMPAGLPWQVRPH